MRVKIGEVVAVGDLSVSVKRTGATTVCLVITEADGASRYVMPPARDVRPGITIDASMDPLKGRTKLAVAAPKDVLIRRRAQHVGGD